MKLAWLLPLLLCCCPLSAQNTASPLIGNWAGPLQVGGTTLHLVFHFAPKADGTLTGTFDSIDQGAMGLAFSKTLITGKVVHLEAPSVGGSFDGALDASNKTLTGRWSQGGGTLPLSLTKTDHVPTLDRPQTPHPPYPYTVQDVSFPGGASGVTLAGTLTTPPGTGPFPAAVLIAGSGPNGRDETIFGHKPFLLLADTLTRRGIAVLRYDKRGVGKSTGSYMLATTEDFARDAQAAAAYLRAQTVINPKRVGLIGHSEGGLIAPLVASRQPDTAFVVLLAGPGLDGDKILLAQEGLIAKAEGSSAKDVSESLAVNRQAFEIVEREPNPAVAQAKVQALVIKAIAGLPAAERAKVGNPAAYAKKVSKPLASPWMRFFLTYDPLPALSRTHCPVLALGGSKDLQVPPAEDLALIGQALKSGGNTSVTVKELPNLNHLLQTCVTGSPSEYAKISETVAPIALTTVSDWVAAQTGTK